MRRPPRIARPSPVKSAAKAEERRIRTAAGHVELIRQIRICAATGRHGDVDPHHLMRGPGVVRGTGLTAQGRYTIPLSRRVHDRITKTGQPEEKLLEWYGVLARELADALWYADPDLDAMIRITMRAYQDAQGRLRR